jgi:hypothetical protein
MDMPDRDEQFVFAKPAKAGLSAYAIETPYGTAKFVDFFHVVIITDRMALDEPMLAIQRSFAGPELFLPHLTIGMN